MRQGDVKFACRSEAPPLGPLGGPRSARSCAVYQFSRLTALRRIFLLVVVVVVGAVLIPFAIGLHTHV